MECSYLEDYFLVVLKQFIKVVVKDIEFIDKLDDYRDVFYKYLEYPKFDHDDVFPKSAAIGYYLILFICDFIFSFVTNFCTFNEEDGFETKFKHFNEFINYSMSLLANTHHDCVNLFELSDKKKELLFETECEKTEYKMKDFPNHYGLCLLFYFFFNGKNHLVNLSTEGKVDVPLIPMVRFNHLKDIVESIAYMVVKTEHNSKIIYLKDYEKFIDVVISEYLYPIIDNVSGDKVIPKILYEISRFKNNDLRIKLFAKLLEKTKDKVTHSLIF
jgi:hypothetical protein